MSDDIPDNVSPLDINRAQRRKIRRSCSLEEFTEQATEALDSVPGMALTLKNDDVVTIPHPMLLDDARQEAVDEVNNRRDLLPKPKKSVDVDGEQVEIDDPDAPDMVAGEDGTPVKAPSFNVRFAKALLGEDAHRRFLAGGGTSNMVLLAFQHLSRGMEGMADDPKLPR